MPRGVCHQPASAHGVPHAIDALRVYCAAKEVRHPVEADLRVPLRVFDPEVQLVGSERREDVPASLHCVLEEGRLDVGVPLRDGVLVEEDQQWRRL